MACLLRERIGNGDVVPVICRRSTEKVGDVSWSSGAGLVLQSFVIRFDLVLIHAHFNLAGESNVHPRVRSERLFQSAKE